ncbi:hypothetical protein N5P37_006805 [Trichoderma harzianum]|nr:hypothetical protein N5P37_006805 [Trichoderma harzianum]
MSDSQFKSRIAALHPTKMNFRIPTCSIRRPDQDTKRHGTRERSGGVQQHRWDPRYLLVPSAAIMGSGVASCVIIWLRITTVTLSLDCARGWIVRDVNKSFSSPSLARRGRG